MTLSRKFSISGFTYEKRLVDAVEFRRRRTNLSVVCVCQKVRGTIDDVYLSVGVPQELVKLLCNLWGRWDVFSWRIKLESAATER